MSCRAGIGRPDPPAEVVGIVDTGVAPGAASGSVDRIASRSFVPGEPLEDTDGHGTEMVEIVHAAAPGARLFVAKAIDSHGATTDARLAAAIDHLRRAGATVVLLSLAGAEPLPRTKRTIEAAGRDGVLVVAAAGNDGLDLRRSPSYPGGYRSANLVTVAATDLAGHLLGTSNRGAPTEVLAPGSVPACGLDGRPVTAGGTSAAAALVAGTAASLGRGRSPTERIDALRHAELAPPPLDCTGS